MTAFWITLWVCVYLAVGCVAAGLSATPTRDTDRETIVLLFWGPLLVFLVACVLAACVSYPFGVVADQIAKARGCREVPDQEAGR